MQDALKTNGCRKSETPFSGALEHHPRHSDVCATHCRFVMQGTETLVKLSSHGIKLPVSWATQMFPKIFKSGDLPFGKFEIVAWPVWWMRACIGWMWPRCWAASLLELSSPEKSFPGHSGASTPIDQLPPLRPQLSVRIISIFELNSNLLALPCSAPDLFWEKMIGLENGSNIDWGVIPHEAKTICMPMRNLRSKVSAWKWRELRRGPARQIISGENRSRASK